MKTNVLPVVALLALLAPIPPANASERTADHVLTTPSEYEGNQVDLDVAFVRPVNWKSPVEELAFFHAMTMDRSDLKPAGAILVAIPVAEAAAFAKKYGTDYEGRYDKDTLTGTLLASPGHGRRGKIWFVDTTGKGAEMIRQNKISLADDGGPGPRERPRGQGQHDRRKDRGEGQSVDEAAKE
jgi:hypothetical protein